MKTSAHKAFFLALLQNFFAWFVERKAIKGHLEVERKFSIAATEYESLPSRLTSFDFQAAGCVVMADTFLPARRQGEMLRIRVEETGGAVSSVFTLKSWVDTKGGGRERQEYEAGVSPLVRTLVVMLGRFACGGELLHFSKKRSLFDGKLDGYNVVVCLDQVGGLGRYSGHYMEIECIVPLGENPEQVRKQIFVFVEKLLGAAREDIKMSYREMLDSSRQN